MTGTRTPIPAVQARDSAVEISPHVERDGQRAWPGEGGRSRYGRIRTSASAREGGALPLSYTSDNPIKAARRRKLDESNTIPSQGRTG